MNAEQKHKPARTEAPEGRRQERDRVHHQSEP